MLQRLHKMICMFLVVAMLVPALATARADSLSAVINASSVKVYASASTSSKSVTLQKGTTVTVQSVSGSWAKITKSGKTAYVNVKYLTTTQRYLRYVSKSTSLYRSAGGSSVRSLSVNTKVYVIGMEGDYYRVQDSSGSITGYVLKSCVSKSKITSTSWKSEVKRTNWFKGGDEAFPEGTYATIYDIDTGISVRIKRMGGHYHADVEPATKEDTAKLLKISGGSWSWDSHAVILMVNGKYIACGINCMPHGDQTITNNGFNGQFCLHMRGSLTHGTTSTNVYHQNSIDRAYSWAVG